MTKEELWETKPSQRMLDDTIEVLEWYKLYMKRVEPYAIVEIETVSDVLNGIPKDMHEFELD